MGLLKLNKYETSENKSSFLLAPILVSGYKSVLIAFFILFSILLIGIAHATANNTGLLGDDQYAGRFPIGFNFKLYDKSYKHFYVSTNGLVQFSNPTKLSDNQCLPASFNHTLYVFWDDLSVTEQATSSSIEYETIGEAPNRQLIIQWNNVSLFGSNEPMGTFQTILYENTNQIKYQYRLLDSELSRGASATIGIQGMKTQFAQISCNQPLLLAPEQAITFTPLSDGTYEIDDDAIFNFIDISTNTTISAPNPTVRYTKSAPSWKWQNTDGFNSYEINIVDAKYNHIDQQIIGNLTNYTYLDGNAVHNTSYRARIRGSHNNGKSWSEWSSFSGITTVDTMAPIVKLSEFSRLSADTIQVDYLANDQLSGIKNTILEIATDTDFTHIISKATLSKYQQKLIINMSIPAGKLYGRVWATDKAGNTSQPSEIKELTLASPLLINPVNGTVTYQANLEVNGQSYPNSDIYFILDDIQLSTKTTSDKNGLFSSLIQLNDEGEHRLRVIAKTELGMTPTSYEVKFNYQSTKPTAWFISPLNNAVLSTNTEIAIAATDKVGIKHIDIYVDNNLLTQLTKTPYNFNWELTHQDNGPKTIKAVVTNNNDKSYTVSQFVTIDMELPPEPLTVYTGKLDSISPTLSYGQPIIIKGKGIYRDSGELVKNAPLKLVLMNSGFKRTILINTDENGHFDYQFIPQRSDKGTYSVALIHPNERITSELGEFTINNISFDQQNINVITAVNVPTKLTVAATANLGTKGLHWELRAQDQSNNQLPAGISIADNKGIDISANNTTKMNITLTIDDRAPKQGEFILVAIAEDSGNIIRGKININYKLTLAKPAIYATPNILETGIAQNDSLIESVTFTNRGLRVAQNVKVTLLDQQGELPPKWLYISSQTDLGNIDIGEQQIIDLMVRPDNKVIDGTYHYLLQITADNHQTITIPVSVAVIQDGKGAIRFDVADIYTATLDKEGNTIQGVAGAKIKLQNETLLSEQYELKTDNNGIATTGQIPPGIYLYRVSADEHQENRGRVRVKPGVTTNQHIFLDYNIVNIDFSVTETDINDIYEIELDITYKTQVPAPVVLIEPAAINLAGLQPGEEKTGQITITNYGLVRADNLNVNLPKSDSRFSYEFFGDIPKELNAKSRIVIPYKVVAKQPANTVTLAKMTRGQQDCYQQQIYASWIYICVKGDRSSGSMSSSYYITSPFCGRKTESGDSHGYIDIGFSDMKYKPSKIKIRCASIPDPCDEGAAK